ncbi:MAG TPA: class I SAM-dependent methyltransferase, partial [Afipia sp.]
MRCRHCHNDLEYCLVDLGSAPPSNAYLNAVSLKAPEKWFPLRVLVCDRCWLVQTEDFVSFDELFDADYAYFSSFSPAWLAHAKVYSEKMTTRFGLGTQSQVVEVAANDGYLLQFFKQSGIPNVGFEPTASTAHAARAKGIEIVETFFGEQSGREMAISGRTADLMAANNVLAHVPDINDFVRGFTALLKPNGVATFEFPSLMQLINKIQFDTIYHEHFSYLSLIAVDRIFSENGLTVFDVESLETHGGSLRVFAQRSDTGQHGRTQAVDEIRNQEISA